MMNNLSKVVVSQLLAFTIFGCATSPATPGSSVYLINCEELGNYASKVGDDNYVIEFQNLRDSDIDVYWINYEGEEVFYESVSTGDKWSQSTFVTHPWVVREKSGNCVAAYQSSSTVRIDIR